MIIVHIAVQHVPRDSRVYYKECKSLAAANSNSVHLLVPPIEPSADDPVTFHRAAAYPDYGCSMFLWLPRYIRCVLVNSARAYRLRGDVYHIHETPLIPIAILLKLLGKRVVYDIHEDARCQAISIGQTIGRPRLGSMYASVSRFYEVAAKWLFDGFVAATSEISQRFPVSRTVVVQNFPLVEEIEELGTRMEACSYAGRPREVLYLGALTAIRGIREIIEAVERVSTRPNCRLSLAGRFDPPKFYNGCRSLPGWKNVDYLGMLDRQGVIDVLAESRIGLVTMHPVSNYTVAWPVKLFEYMAAGIPVIASDFPKWRQWFECFGCVRFVDPLNPDAIAREIEYLLEYEEEAAAMGERGRIAVCERFNWGIEEKKLHELYARFA